MIVQTHFADVEWTPDGCVSRFMDGASWGAQPHDVPHYHAAAHRFGYGGDIMAYAREHEVCHHLVAEAFDRPSVVLWGLAHNNPPAPYAAASEEALTMALQRYLRAGEVPLVDCVDWSELRARAVRLLGATLERW